MNINDEQITQEFTIESADTANWAIKQIADKRKRLKYFCDIANQEIEKLKNQIDTETETCEDLCNFLIGALGKYIENEDVPVKTTKTQTSLKLPAGKIIKKHEEKKIKTLDGQTPSSTLKSDVFIDSVEKIYPEYIKKTKSVEWSNMKSILTISDENEVLDSDTGEIIDFLKVEVIPPTIKVECNE